MQRRSIGFFTLLPWHWKSRLSGEQHRAVHSWEGQKSRLEQNWYDVERARRLEFTKAGQAFVQGGLSSQLLTFDLFSRFASSLQVSRFTSAMIRRQQGFMSKDRLITNAVGALILIPKLHRSNLTRDLERLCLYMNDILSAEFLNAIDSLFLFFHQAQCFGHVRFSHVKAVSYILSINRSFELLLYRRRDRQDWPLQVQFPEVWILSNQLCGLLRHNLDVRQPRLLIHLR